jgi:hypothetical protein
MELLLLFGCTLGVSHDTIKKGCRERQRVWVVVTFAARYALALTLLVVYLLALFSFVADRISQVRDVA